MRIDEIDMNKSIGANARSRSPRLGGPPMSQISGVSRPLLSHTNSFSGERLPTFGVDTPNEQALGTLLGDIDVWGIDIFKISELSLYRPLTCVAYTVFQVSCLCYRFYKTFIFFFHLLSHSYYHYFSIKSM